MKELSLFTGAGGGLLGTHLLGWEPVGYVEWNEYCQKVIRQRIEDEIIPRAPIFCDVRAFASEGYAEAYTGMVDVVSAGFPCQPFSVSGHQRGEDDPRNMWPATRDIIAMVRPRYALLENVPGLLANGYIRRIFGDLAELGFNTRWGVLGGHDIRGGIADGKRLWIIAAAPDSPMLESVHIFKPEIANTEESCGRQHTRAVGAAISQDDYARVKRDADVVAEWMERVKAIGNGQMGPLVADVWQTLMT